MSFCLFNRFIFLGSLFGETHSRRQIASGATTSPSLGHASTIQQQQQQQAHAQQQQQQQAQSTNTISVNTTNALLARAFGILIRQITDLLIKWPAVLSASSLYHDVVITSSTVDEQNAVDTMQVNNIHRNSHPSTPIRTYGESSETFVRF